MNKPIPLFKVFMSPEAPEAVASVLESGYVAQGPVVDAFEEDLHKFCGHEVAVVNSCTSAIELALHLAGISAGDEVITTAQTCVATNSPIVRIGATPVFVDIDPRSGLIDPDDVRRNMTGKTMAIVAVDWAGHPCDYNALRSFGVPIIEDAAHSVGTIHNGKHIAVSGGDYVCLSFQAIKHLTTGDGGALRCPDKEQLERAKRLRWFGLDRNANISFRIEQDVEEAGYKFQMNDIAAAIGRTNIRHLDDILTKHRANALALRSVLRGVSGIGLPRMDAGSSWWLFTITVKEPKAFVVEMASRGVSCSPVHPRNDTLTAFKKVCRLSSHLSGLDEFSSKQVSIPVGWWLESEDIAAIVEAVASSVRAS